MLRFKRLQSKLFVYFLGLVLIPVVSLGFFSYWISTGIMEQQFSENQRQSVKLIGNHIKLMLNDARDISEYIISNETIQNTLKQPNPSTLNDAQKILFDYLSNLKQAKSYITFIVVYGENGFLFRDFKEFYRQVIDYNHFKSTNTYLATAAHEGEAYWEFSSSSLFIYSGVYPELMIGRRITNVYDPDDKLGMLFMGFSRDALQETIHDSGIAETHDIFIFDDNFHLVTSSNPDRAISSYLDSNLNFKRKLFEKDHADIYEVNHKKYLVANALIEDYNWNVISFTPVENIERQINIVLRTTIVLTISLIAVIAALSVVLSSSITSPIKRLLQSMNNFKRGNFNQQVEVKSRDEIGMLGAKYNDMVTELNSLIQKVYISKTNQKIIELRTLQTQIQPHFLYNTLDFIFLNAKMHGDEQTSEVVHALSQLFRLSLNKGQDYYKVGDEIEQIRAYVQIQHARFPNRFDPHFEIDPETLDWYTLKLLLQPIVENAILHAFHPDLPRPGRLLIRSRLERDCIQFQVEDNGVGMKPAQIEELLSVPENSHGGYGVRNVNERLQMLFGKAYALRIESKLEEGTTVTVKIPLVKSEEEWRKLYEVDRH